MKPLIIVNFKAYNEGLGGKGITLIRLLSSYENVIMSVPSPLINLASGFFCNEKTCSFKTRIFAQHIDNVKPGAHTGSVTVEEVKMAGASGSLINHSEKRIPINDIQELVKKLKENNMISIVCCQNLNEAKKIAKFKPDFIAYEPPELIGGDISVSSTKPEVIAEIVKQISPIKLLVGAGVKTREDITKSMELGAKGILVASGVIKANKNDIKELIEW